ncbi:MAG: hypothetical protein JSV26_10175 [bacterium]|nr:MAG: hypothetical protein JSV26_10175 [bacterium]
MKDLLYSIGWFLDHPAVMGWLLVTGLLSAIVYVVVIVIAVARMSPDYFASDRPADESWRGRHPFLRILIRVMKSLLGLVFLLAGLMMLVLPGQGLLTVLIGISLLEFPGKRRLQLFLVRRSAVFNSLNWIRKRAGREELLMPERKERGEN